MLKSIATLFAHDSQRRTQHHITAQGLMMDYSRHPFDSTDYERFEKHASFIFNRLQALFAGEVVNSTENRAVTHMQYRLASDPDLERAKSFAAQIRRENTITDIVHVGIGGSHLGPALYYDVCRSERDAITLHFLSNIDPDEWQSIESRINPATTLVVLVSKSFSTLETLENAALIKQTHPGIRFLAVTAAPEKAAEWGVAPADIFTFPPSIGGRFSVWSPVSLSVMMACGVQSFERFLAGGQMIDSAMLDSIKNDKPLKNMAYLMAVLGSAHRQLGARAYAVLPYAARLGLLPSYLQQLDMESNGKSVAVDNSPINISASGGTGPIVFGQPGTNGQHAFVQWLHQGTDIIPVDFLVFKQTTAHAPATAQDKKQAEWLVANAVAQAEALAFGQQHENPHRSFAGGRPSTLFVFDRLDSYALGQIIALYEYKIMIQGWLWGINSFDQFGVELGKITADSLYESMQGTHPRHPALFFWD